MSSQTSTKLLNNQALLVSLNETSESGSMHNVGRSHLSQQVQQTTPNKHSFPLNGLNEFNSESTLAHYHPHHHQGRSKLFGSPQYESQHHHHHHHHHHKSSVAKSMAQLMKLKSMISGSARPEKSISCDPLINGTSSSFSSSASTLSNNQQGNALYVVDSNGKLNVIDGNTNQQFHLNRNISNKMNDSEHGSMFNSVLTTTTNTTSTTRSSSTLSSSSSSSTTTTTSIATDLPQLKKAFATSTENTPQYTNFSYPNESVSNIPLNDSYFNLFVNHVNQSQQSSSSEISFLPPPQQPPPPPQPLPPSTQSHSHSTQSISNENVTQVGNFPDVHHERTPAPTNTRGRKRSKKGPFICGECHKEFSNQSTLTKHMITHSDERKFVCVQCSKAFKRHDHLNGHMLTHREHKPYACDIDGCDKSYCDARSLRRHKEKHREGIIQCSTNDGIQIVSQKLPGLSSSSSSSSVSSHKGIGNNLLPHNHHSHHPHYQPFSVNASAQLQYIAMQQQKTATTSSSSSSTTATENNNASNGINNFSSYPTKPVSNEHHDLDQSLLLNRRTPYHNSQSSYASDNALLHQLLTTSNASVANPLPHNGTPTSERNLYRSSNSNHSSTVIKMTDEYLNMINGQVKDSNLENNGTDVTGKMSQLVSETTESDIECTICPKRFKTSSALNGHMRLHGGYFKMNYLLNLKSDLNESVQQTETIPIDHGHPKSLNSTTSLPYTVDSYSHLNPPPPNHSHMINTLAYEKGNDSFNDLHHQEIQNYQQQQQQQQQQQLVHQHQPSHHQAHSHHMMSGNNSSRSLMQSQQTSIESTPFKTPSLHYETSQIEPPKPQVINNCHQINEMMFSPITPVTPLNNKTPTQFTFDFSQPTVTTTPQQQSVNNQTKLPKDEPTTPKALNDQSQHYQPQPDPYMTFDDNPPKDMIEKNDLTMEHITGDNFDDIANPVVDEVINDPVKTETIELNEKMDQDENGVSNGPFDQFDLPSGKLTSDLYNRRMIRKHLSEGLSNDPNKVRELQIKQIAASLQSFGQNYERNHSNLNHNHHHGQNLGGHSMNHSYSVPTTPLIMSSNGYSNNQIDDNTYHTNSMSHHHSLPTTPIDTSHFTFNIIPDHNPHQQQGSLPSTPIETNQFTFAPIDAETEDETTIQQNENGFDLSCLNTEPEYGNDDFIYDNTVKNQDLDAHFIENEDSIINFETTTNENQQTNQSNGTENISFSDDLYTRSIEASTYQSSTYSNVNQCLDQNNKENTIIPTFSTNFDNQSQHQVTSEINQTNRPLIHHYQQSDQQQHQQTNQMMMEHSLSKPIQIEITKDINSNYIINTDNDHDHSIVPKQSSLAPSRTSDNKLQSPKISNASVIHRATPLKQHLLGKHHKTLATNSNTNSTNSSINQPSLVKKKHRPAPLYIPPHVNTFMYHSRLRSPRFWPSSNTSIGVTSNFLPIEPAKTFKISPPPYTPPPMLSPIRSGPGLFWKLNNNKLKSSSEPDLNEPKTPTTAYEPLIYEYEIPQTDVQPHVNIGPNYQARIPAFNTNRRNAILKTDKADLVWHPRDLYFIDDEQLDLYTKLSCSMCLPGKGNNLEYAIHQLHQSDGKLNEALKKLVNSEPVTNRDNPLSDYHYANNQSWTTEEINLFQESLLKNDKDFFLIAHEVKTKSVKQCIEFYYIWKKNFPDVIKRLRFLRRKRESVFYNIQQQQQQTSEMNKNGIVDESRRSSNCDLVNYNIDMIDNIDHHSNSRGRSVRTTTGSSNTTNAYPCPKCGKTFKKLRSRSAHMKIHGNE